MKKLAILVGAVAALGLAAGTGGQALAATTWIVNDGTTEASPCDGTPDFTGANAIQEAIDAVLTIAGDTILICPGTYAETSIDVDKSLTIMGSGTSATFLDPGGSGNIFFPNADGITFKDMTIQNGSQGMRFEKAGGTIDNTEINNVHFVNHTSRGIEVHNATTVTDLLIDQSEFNNTNIGIRVSSSGHLDGVDIWDSTFKDNVIGFYVANDGGSSTARDLIVTGSTFQNNSSYAIFVEELQDAVIEDNQFIDNRRDIQIFKWYQASVAVSNVVIRNNTMTGTTDAVFAIFNAEHSSGQTEFDDVRFTGNTATDIGRSAVYAGGHSTVPSDGGIGWETVAINCNSFLGIPVANEEGVRFWAPAGIAANDTLGGASIDVTRNWWGTTHKVAVKDLLQNPAITDYLPILGGAPSPESCTAIDIRPGNDRNFIDPDSRGVIWVAILSAPGFDATTVDALTVEFGPDGAIPDRAGPNRDVDRDGRADMLLRFQISETGIEFGDVEACLTGETTSSESFAGCDAISTVGP